MSKKRSGAEDLADTLIKQHGAERAFWVAVDARREMKEKHGIAHVRYQLWKRVVYIIGYGRPRGTP